MKYILTIYLSCCFTGLLHAQLNDKLSILQLPQDSLKNIFKEEAWGKQIFLGKSKNGTPIHAYYYNRGGTDSALVMAGVHGSEFLGVEVADSVKIWLDRKKDSIETFKWKVLVLPSLFVDRVNAKQNKKMTTDNEYRCETMQCEQFDTTGHCIDPNRQMPTIGTLYTEGMKSKIGTEIERENQYLLILTQAFNPSRIVSVHCKHEKSKEQIGIYADPRTTQTQKALGFEHDALLAIKMAFRVQEDSGRILGNFLLTSENEILFDKLRVIYPLDDKAAKKDANQKRSFEKRKNTYGVSFGTWAATEIRSSDKKLLKQAATMITIEMPQYYSFFKSGKEKVKGAKDKNVAAYTAAITQVFLSEK